jgi:hypothetical protein
MLLELLGLLILVAVGAAAVKLVEEQVKAPAAQAALA